jgi:hypothetical protein
MSNNKDIKFGHDKRQVSIVPNDRQPLYNIASGEPLVDEFGFPIVTEVDTFFLPDASEKRSTSVVFANEESTSFRDEIISIATTESTYLTSNTNNVGIATTGNSYEISVGDIILGPSIPGATTVSRVGIGSIYISNFTTNVGIKTELVQIKRKTRIKIKSSPTIKIAEQFKEVSEVSSSLLGVPRDERQLSLFANVSSYGLDSDDFEYYTYNTRPSNFDPWNTRINSIYGERFGARITEEVQESGIKLTSFPVPWDFPWGPKFQKYGDYNANLFEQYINFIDLGNDLYDYFNEGDGSFYPSGWKDKFLPREFASVSSEDVIYSEDLDLSFSKIDIWTETWRDIVDVQLIDPVTGENFNFQKINSIFPDPRYTRSTTRPGYSTIGTLFSYLQSRKSFRYQPGRISGFTFGVRSSVEAKSGFVLEWGIANETDQYVFRIDRGQFSIVRRSTFPLGAAVLERNGLTANDEQLILSGEPYNSTLYYTTVIPQDNFNGDQLRGNGPSRYILKPENVTMYKIEFGWYGAIGARFYAYVPVSNGEARWVVLHTLVIENSLGYPCLENSYFRFKYSLNISNCENIRTPVYLYKYGASYYIDGGDEGATQIYSAKSGEKVILPTKSKTVFGILPKENILNSNGIPIKNRNLIIPTKLNITSDSLTEVKIVSCKACPGFGHVYTPGVATTEFGRKIDIQFNDGNTIEAINGYNFTASDVGAKIIAPSIHDVYIKNVVVNINTGVGNTATIGGFSGGSNFTLGNRDITDSPVFDQEVGITTQISVGTGYTVRLSNYDSYVASNFALTGSKIEIQFVNPISKDDYGHYADSLIGLTDKIPVTSGSNSLNGFIIGAATTTVLPNSNIIYGDNTHSSVNLDINGVERSETWTVSTLPTKTAIDTLSRIPRLSDPAGGICSKLTFEIQPPQPIVNLSEGPDGDLPPVDGIWITTQNETLMNFDDYEGSNVAIRETNGSVSISNVTFIGSPKSYTVPGPNNTQTTYYSIQISGPLGRTEPFTILLKSVKCSGGLIDKIKIFNYDTNEFYFVSKLKDNAAINNISIKETIGDFQRTISPPLYTLNATIDNVDGKASSNAVPTNFNEITRLSSALIDNQNEQELRRPLLETNPSYVELDSFYVGENTTKSVDLSKVFGADRKVVTPDNNGLEATFIIAKKIDSGADGTLSAAINFKEQ